MAANSKIEWTDASWTPIRARNLKTGKIGWHCEHVTSGCEFCYAENMNKRLGTGLSFKPGHRKDIQIFLDETMLLAPLRWKKPRMIFVCSMTDAFADFVKDEWLDKMFAVMALCPQHTFQVLTKRPERMREYVDRAKVRAPAVNEYVCGLAQSRSASSDERLQIINAATERWPLPNVWLGTSCEDQKTFNERWPHLRATSAAVTFISMEPLLGPIFFRPAKPDWIIVGGESGPKARPMHPQWVRNIRDQCKAAGVPFFFKQWGAFVPSRFKTTNNSGVVEDRASCAWITTAWPDGTIGNGHKDEHGGYGISLERETKKDAGRLLDGIEHNEFPAVVR
jgi:protein gp37